MPERQSSSSGFSLYSTITCQTFSTQGDYYAASSEDGLVGVWRSDQLSQDPVRLWKAAKGAPVSALASTDRFLITACRGELQAWEWSSLADGSPSWTIRGPFHHLTAINWIATDKHEDRGDRLIAGCGDNNVYVFDLETRELLHTLAGHRKYVHSVAAADGSGGVSVVSGGEDGAVKLWDTRSSKPEIHSFLPHTEAELGRPDLGTFVSSVSTAGDWLVCGGGPAASLWNLSTRIMSSRLPPEEGCVFATQMLDETIWVAAQNKPLNKTNFGGELCGEMKVRSSCVYSLAVNSSKDLLAAAGAFNTIDFFSPTNNSLVQSIFFPTK